MNLDNQTAINMTVLSSVVQAVMAVLMGIVAYSARSLAKQQNNNMLIQINLDLYEKRFKIYTSLTKLIDSTLSLQLPKDTMDLTRFINQGAENLKTFWQESKERTFLIDDELNDYINYVEKKVQVYLTTIASNPPPKDGAEFVAWLTKMQREEMAFLKLYEEIPQKFKKCLDFRKIHNIPPYFQFLRKIKKKEPQQ
jgi:hypothetical protein